MAGQDDYADEPGPDEEELPADELSVGPLEPSKWRAWRARLRESDGPAAGFRFFNHDHNPPHFKPMVLARDRMKTKEEAKPFHAAKMAFICDAALGVLYENTIRRATSDLTQTTSALNVPTVAVVSALQHLHDNDERFDEYSAIVSQPFNITKDSISDYWVKSNFHEELLVYLFRPSVYLRPFDQWIDRQVDLLFPLPKPGTHWPETASTVIRSFIWSEASNDWLRQLGRIVAHSLPNHPAVREHFGAIIDSEANAWALLFRNVFQAHGIPLKVVGRDRIARIAASVHTLVTGIEYERLIRKTEATHAVNYVAWSSNPTAALALLNGYSHMFAVEDGASLENRAEAFHQEEYDRAEREWEESQEDYYDRSLTREFLKRSRI